MPDGSVLRGVLPMAIQTMQESKVRLGNVLSQQFGKPMPGQTGEAGQKLRMDLKDRIAALEPGVAPLNQEVGPLYPLEQALKERGEVFGRQNILPMRPGIGSWVFGASPNNLRHVIGAMLGMSVDDPRVLSRAAMAARPFGKARFKGGVRAEDFSRTMTPLSRAGEVGALAPETVTEEALRRALLDQLR